MMANMAKSVKISEDEPSSKVVYRNLYIKGQEYFNMARTSRMRGII
jgi:hypothetical protein